MNNDLLKLDLLEFNKSIYQKFYHLLRIIVVVQFYIFAFTTFLHIITDNEAFNPFFEIRIHSLIWPTIFMLVLYVVKKPYNVSGSLILNNDVIQINNNLNLKFDEISNLKIKFEGYKGETTYQIGRAFSIDNGASNSISFTYEGIIKKYYFLVKNKQEADQLSDFVIGLSRILPDFKYYQKGRKSI